MQLQSKGYIAQGNGCGGCGGGCGGCGSASAAQPFDLCFRNGGETYAAARSGEQLVSTVALAFVDLVGADQFDSIELVAVRSSGPVVLRINGLPATFATACLWPNAGLSGLTLQLGIDGTPVNTTFVSGDDTADEVARRINAAAALAGLRYPPASVNLLGQVQLEGALTGPQGVLSAPGGTSLSALGLSSQLGVFGTGADIPVDGLYVNQFTRAKGAKSIQVSGQATLSVLVAGS